MERAHEVLALGEVDGGLASDRRVDLADQRRRDGDPGDPAQVRRRREPGDVGRAAAAEGDDGAAAVELQLPPEPLDRPEALRFLAGSQRVGRRLERRAVQAEHGCICDDLGLAGDDLP